MNLKAFIELLRPVNCLMAAFGVFIGYSVAMQAIELNDSILLAMLAAFLICGAGQAINDFFDLETDRKKNARKPIIMYKLNPFFALLFSFILFISGSAIAFQLGTIPFAIAVAFSLLLIIYSALLSKAKYIGNWVVALGTAFTLIFGASLTVQYLEFLTFVFPQNFSTMLFFALAALFANVSRELIKDLEDLKADTGFKKSLPMLLSRKKVLTLIAVLYIAAILIALIPFAFGKANIYFFVMVLFSGIVFKMSLMSAAHKYYSLGQKYSKVGMLIALFAFIVSVF